MSYRNPSASTDAAASAPAEVAMQCLTFRLGQETYGVDVLEVQEIRGWEACATLPGTPDYVLGVINLRGAIVPVIDLRRRLGLPPRAPDNVTVVIVVRQEDARGDRMIGLVVDAVSDVCRIGNGQLRSAPQFDDTVESCFVGGLADVDGQMVILLKLADVAGEA